MHHCLWICVCVLLHLTLTNSHCVLTELAGVPMEVCVCVCVSICVCLRSCNQIHDGGARPKVCLS